MNRSRVVALSFMTMCVALVCLSSSYSQVVERGIGMTQPGMATPANYYLAKPGELTMQLNLWGMVNHPGRYEVSIATDLVQLISYAGGPQSDANLSDVKITRLLKTDAGVSRAEYVVNIENLYRVSESNITLQPGDTIFIDRTSWSVWRDIVAVVTSVVVVAASVTTIARHP